MSALWPLFVLGCALVGFVASCWLIGDALRQKKAIRISPPVDEQQIFRSIKAVNALAERRILKADFNRRFK